MKPKYTDYDKKIRRNNGKNNYDQSKLYEKDTTAVTDIDAATIEKVAVISTNEEDRREKLGIATIWIVLISLLVVILVFFVMFLELAKNVPIID